MVDIIIQIILSLLILSIICGGGWFLWTHIQTTIKEKEEKLTKNLTDSNAKINTELKDKLPLTTYKTDLDIYKKDKETIKSTYDALDKAMNAKTTELKTDITKVSGEFVTLKADISTLGGVVSGLDQSLNTKFNTLETNFTTLNGSLVKDFAVFTAGTAGNVVLASPADISSISLDKPLILNGWSIEAEAQKTNTSKNKLCFKKEGKKILCISDSDKPLEMYKVNGAIQENVSDIENFIRGP
jgi:hypothetical protein